MEKKRIHSRWECVFVFFLKTVQSRNLYTLSTCELCCFPASILFTPLLVWQFAADVGSVLKVVSITQENWLTEEVVLEELQVFQVRCPTRTHRHAQHTSFGLFVFTMSCAFINCRNSSIAPFSGTADPPFLFVLQTFVCRRFRLPSLVWRCLRSRFVPVIKYFIPTAVLLY